MYLEKEVIELIEMLNNSADEYGEISDADFEAFESLRDEEIAPRLERMQKARGYIQGNIHSIDEEIERLKARKESFKKQDERLKSRLLNIVQAVGKTTTSLFTFSTRSSTSVNVSNEALIPDDYCVFKNVRTVDKTSIKKAIESGLVVDGAELSYNTSLQVK